MRTRLTKYFAVAAIAPTIIFCSCHQPQKKYSIDERNFESYLMDVFHKPIKDDSTNYIIVSDYGCHSCIDIVTTLLSKYKKSLFIVSPQTYKEYLEPYALTPDHYLIDSTEKINRLKYHNGNIGILQTYHKSIYNITFLEPEGVKNALAALAK